MLTTHHHPIVVIGAGVAGLLAARDLQAAGHTVVVLDKGHRPGGRLATRRVGPATFDHGAQFLTARTDRFASEIDRLIDRGVVAPWFHGLPDLTPRDPAAAAADAEPRLRGTPTMRAIAEHLAEGLDVRLAARVTSVARSSGAGWAVTAVDDAGQDIEVAAHALVMTPPTPQTLALLDAGNVDLSTPVRDELNAIAYDPSIAVLAIPDGPTSLPSHGALRVDDPEVAWLTDNLRSGASEAPAVTIHATADLARELWDQPDDVVGSRLTSSAERYLDVGSTPVYVQRWRFAAPTSAASAPALLDRADDAVVVFAGDGLAGGRVEGAATSGFLAAQLLIDALG